MHVIQKKSLRLMFISKQKCWHRPSFQKKPEILKIVDKVDLDNWILISKPLHKTLLKILCDWFTLSFEPHTYNIRWANKCSFSLYQTLWQILLLQMEYMFWILWKFNTRKPYSIFLTTFWNENKSSIAVQWLFVLWAWIHSYRKEKHWEIK